MRIYVSHALEIDFQELLYQPLKQSKLWKQHEFVLLHDKRKKSVNPKPVIKTCDRVLAEISYPSTDQGIELAWAQLLGIPIIGLQQQDKSCSSSVSLIVKTILTYQDPSDMIKQLEIWLGKIAD